MGLQDQMSYYNQLLSGLLINPSQIEGTNPFQILKDTPDVHSEAFSLPES